MQLLSTTAARQALRNPLAVLRRGYTMALDEEGSVVTSAAMLSQGEDLTLRFADGHAAVSVRDVSLFESENHT